MGTQFTEEWSGPQPQRETQPIPCAVSSIPCVVSSQHTSPVSVCRNCRIPVSRLVQGKAYHGYNEAKKEYFYGFKVQLITTAEGLPVNYYITAGSFHDATALQAMQLDLPAGSELYGDSGYTDYEQEDLYAECDQIYLRIHRKSNSKRADAAWDRYLKKVFRKPIETVISSIENLFPRKLHAVTAGLYAQSISVCDGLHIRPVI